MLRAISSGPRDVSGRLVFRGGPECLPLQIRTSYGVSSFMPLYDATGGVSEHINAGLRVLADQSASRTLTSRPMWPSGSLLIIWRSGVLLGTDRHKFCRGRRA